MRLSRFETAAAFLDAVRPVLATVDDDAGLALAVWMDGAHPLLLASDRDDVTQATDAIVAVLADHGPRPDRVIGAVGQVETFASAWTRRTGRPTRVAMRQRV